MEQESATIASLNKALAEPSQAAKIKAAFQAHLKAERDKHTVSTYDITVVHILTCKLCHGVYTHSYIAKKKDIRLPRQNEAKHDTNHWVEEQVQCCHLCPERLPSMDRDALILHVIDRVRVLARGGN